MNVEEIFSEALKQQAEKNYDAALKLLANAKKSLDEFYRKVYSSEAAVFKERGNFVKEYYALKKILPLLKFSSPPKKNLLPKFLFALRQVAKICFCLMRLQNFVSWR